MKWGGYLNRKKKQLVFILICLITLCLAGIFVYKYQLSQEAYNNIQLTFKKSADSYEVNTELTAIEFIESTNAQDINYPKMDTSKVGEHTYVYVAEDINGNKREFILLLNIVDSVNPIITLTTNTVSKYVGEDIDLTSYIKEAYDPVDGKLEVDMQYPKNYKDVGVHEIIYQVKDKHGNLEKAFLRLTVSEKPKEEQNNANDNNRPNNGDNSNSNGNSTTPSTSNKDNVIKPNKPSNQQFLFSAGYDMNSATSTCAGALSDAKKKGFGGGCWPMKNETGIYIGMELKID